jgi:plasmid stability protein
MAPMRTLYIRNVPDDVAERLARLASRDGVSVNAFVVKELSEAARRADNEALLSDLPAFAITPAEAAADIAEGRRGR